MFACLLDEAQFVLLVLQARRESKQKEKAPRDGAMEILEATFAKQDECA